MLDNFLTEPQCEDFEEEDLSWEGACPFSNCDWQKHSEED